MSLGQSAGLKEDPGKCLEGWLRELIMKMYLPLGRDCIKLENLMTLQQLCICLNNLLTSYPQSCKQMEEKETEIV